MNVLVTGARAPIAADLARALSLAGHRVWVSDSLRWPLGAASPFVAGYVRLPAPRRDFGGFCSALVATCERLALDAIVPTSEEVFWLAGARHRLPSGVDLRTSALPVLAQLHHKGEFARLAASLSYGAAANHVLTSRDEIAALREPERYVFKPVYSRFAARTLLAPTPRELGRLRPTPAEPWLAQTRIAGRELCAYNVAHDGRLLLHIAYAPLVRHGVGASINFGPVEHAGLRELCERIVVATGFTGQISFDVMETDDGRLVALECNPRGTSGAHLAAQHPAVLATALLGQATAPAGTLPTEPRLLRVPLLLNQPSAWLRWRKCRERDALRTAGLPLHAQLLALTEMTWLALRHRTSLARASTADFEWNGEAMRE